MPSSKEFRDYVLEQLRYLDNIVCKPMMGEFLLYCNNTLFGGIYDNRLMVKITQSNDKYNLAQQIPYPTAKPMYVVENIDDMEYLKNIIEDTCKGLSKKA